MPVPAGTVERVGRHLREINHALKRHYAVLLCSEGLTFPQMVVLRRITEKGETTLAEITGELQLAASTLSGIVKRLERDGLIEKVADPNDLRVFRLRALPKAQELLARAMDIYKVHLGRVLGHFSPEELVSLVACLEKLSEAIVQETPTGLGRGEQG